MSSLKHKNCVHETVRCFRTVQSKHIWLSTNLSTDSNFMLLRAHALTNYPTGMLPDLSGLRRFKKICVVPTFISRGKENLVSVFARAVLFSLPERFVCAQTRLRLVCVWMCVRGSNLETASINTVMWAAWRSHWRNLDCSQMNTSQKGGGGVADVIARGQRNTQHPLISPALLALYLHVRVIKRIFNS